MNLPNFSESEYLFTAVFYIGHTLFLGHESTFLRTYCLDTLLLSI